MKQESFERLASGRYALITGASQGFGRCLAIELARLHIPTILVSLPGENIQQVAAECRSFGVDSCYYETDLSVRENVIALTEWVKSKYSIYLLINNAGRGGSSLFVDTDPNYLENVIDLNILATVLITHQLLPMLLLQPQAYVLNVSSMASFCPIGYKTVYPASKRFVQHFSRGLFQELKDTNVFVSVVHPGPMKTNRNVTSRIEQQGFFGRIGLLSPELAAKITIRKLLKKDSMILLGWLNKLNWLLLTLVPIWVKLPLLTSIVKREIRHPIPA